MRGGTPHLWRIRTESDKLLTAHFSDAIDLATLKRHQDRIRTQLADVNQKLTEHDEHQSGGHPFLHDSLRLLADAQHAYACSNDADRRLTNQAFYTLIDNTEDDSDSTSTTPETPNGNTQHFLMSRVPVRHFRWR